MALPIPSRKSTDATLIEETALSSTAIENKTDSSSVRDDEPLKRFSSPGPEPTEFQTRSLTPFDTLFYVPVVGRRSSGESSEHEHALPSPPFNAAFIDQMVREALDTLEADSDSMPELEDLDANMPDTPPRTPTPDPSIDVSQRATGTPSISVAHAESEPSVVSGLHVVDMDSELSVVPNFFEQDEQPKPSGAWWRCC